MNDKTSKDLDWLTSIVTEFINYFVVDDDILSVEQPFTYDFGMDRMVLLDCVGIFLMPEKHFESLNVWTHEFIEKTISEKIISMDETDDFCICLDDRCVTVFHLLTGLTTGSGWDEEDLTPEMFWERMRNRM